MKKIPKQEYMAEFKEQAVKQVKMGKSIGLVAKELGLVEQTLRNWVKMAAAGKLKGTGTQVVTLEQMDLSRLRAENVRLKRECEILKKATGIFSRRDVYDIRCQRERLSVVKAWWQTGSQTSHRHSNADTDPICSCRT